MIYLVGASEKTHGRLRNLVLFKLIQAENVLGDRTFALQLAVDQLSFQGSHS